MQDYHQFLVISVSGDQPGILTIGVLYNIADCCEPFLSCVIWCFVDCVGDCLLALAGLFVLV
jgi:hypothetical protein